ncbi:MAG: serpin family protein [Desulfobacterales bacterium]
MGAKFRMTSQFMLADVLRSLGMTDAFSASADFSGDDRKKDLFVSTVIHKAFADVNGEGTEAGTTAVVMARSAAVPSSVFRADHRFLFSSVTMLGMHSLSRQDESGFAGMNRIYIIVSGIYK